MLPPLPLLLHEFLIIIINIHKTTMSSSALTKRKQQQATVAPDCSSPATKALLRDIGLLSPEETPPQESPASFSSFLSASPPCSPSAVLVQPAYSPTTTEDHSDLITKLDRIAAASRNRRVLKVKDSSTIFTNSDGIGIAMALGSNVSSALRPVIGFEIEDHSEDKRIFNQRWISHKRTGPMSQNLLTLEEEYPDFPWSNLGDNFGERDFNLVSLHDMEVKIFNIYL